MRTKINGRYYDTNTGTLVCQCAKGQLYKKYNANEFFLYDRRKTITPISWDEAKEIVRVNGSRIFYTNFFDPTANPKRTNIDIPIVSYNKLRELAGYKKTSMQNILVDLIDSAHRNRDRHTRKI